MTIMKTIINKKTVKLYWLMLMVLSLLYQSCTCSKVYVPPKNGPEEFILGGLYTLRGIDLPRMFYETRDIYKLNEANPKEIRDDSDIYSIDMTLVKDSPEYKCMIENYPVVIIIIAQVTNKELKGELYSFPVLLVKKILYVKKASINR